MKRLIAITLAAAAITATAAQAEVRISPPSPYVEHTDAGDSANFDIIVTNAAPYEQTLTKVEILYLDAAGKTVLERRIDGNGVAPAIETVPGRDIAAGASKLVFNPFPLQPPGVHATSVRVRVTLDADKRTPQVLEATTALKQPPAQPLRLPLSGKVSVWDGHDALSHHRRWDYTHPAIQGFGFHHNAMRYSYDLVPVDAEGRMFTGDESKNESYVGWGMDVLAPADGTVVETHNDSPDAREFEPSVLAKNINLVFGNYVVIRHADGVFSILGHVRQGSVKVKAGDTVKQGQVVAQIGASGSSLFPHLHYQLQEGPTQDSEGIPSRFDGVTPVNRVSTSGWIDSGDVVTAK